MPFYVYENWRAAGHAVMIHRGAVPGAIMGGEYILEQATAMEGGMVLFQHIMTRGFLRKTLVAKYLIATIVGQRVSTSL